VYASDEALWRDTVQKNPAAWNAHNNLACNLAERGQLEAAMEHFSKSLELNPRNAQAHLNLAKGLLLTGRFQAAEPHFQKVLELKPEDVETLMTYGRALAENRRIEEAVQHLRKAAAHKPTPQICLLLANLLAASGKLEAAAVEYRKVIAAEPNSSEALNNLAWIRAGAPDQKLRNGPEAVQLAQAACRLTNFQQPAALGTLAAAFAEAGDFTNAALTAQSAIDLAIATGNKDLATGHRRLLQRYQAGKSLPLPHHH
jgi:tetratricopeptide (TPR) repeat protein